MTPSWQHGYYSDTSYTYGFYKEFAPNWLDWVALLKGSEPPDTSARMLELGCGQGLGLCVMAASNPHMRFAGVDFNPEQIAHARSLVRRTGLSNIEFHEADFVSLADKDGGIGPCDYVVAHGIQSRLDQLKKTAADNENYIFHEYFHTSWTLFYFTQIAEEAAQGKLRFLGTATLPENYDTLLPEPMRKVLDTAPDQVDLKFKTGFGEVTGKQEVYKPIIDQIARGPVKIADLTQVLPGMNMGSLLQSLTLLAHGGAVGFYVPDADTGPAVAFNQALAERVSFGAPYRYLALPGIGSGISLDEIQWMAVDAYGKKESIPAGVARRLKALNKSLIKDGQALAQGDATVRELETRLGVFVDKTLPMIQRLGGVQVGAAVDIQGLD